MMRDSVFQEGGREGASPLHKTREASDQYVRGVDWEIKKRSGNCKLFSC